ncbi:MAG: cyclase family protein [Flavobacteriales bacterium]|nr:cyclase family protein [Flavobacteriales bacterium]
MIFKTTFRDKEIAFDSSVYFDLSTPISDGENNVNAYYIANPVFQPFRGGDFVGSVALGGACNCENLTLNAHGNGTHTECVGHISKEKYTINQCLKEFVHVARLISVTPEKLENGDLVISEKWLEGFDYTNVNALIIRSLPNDDSKLRKQYSGTNPTYLSSKLTQKVAELGINHLIIDLPSVDKEEDGGMLSAHHAFWQYPQNTRTNATITELAFVPNGAADGLYVLQMQIAPLETDASPSKPIIYPIV